jgi:hypothetical protein
MNRYSDEVVELFAHSEILPIFMLCTGSAVTIGLLSVTMELGT